MVELLKFRATRRDKTRLLTLSDRPSKNFPCPLGFICDDQYMSSCASIQSAYLNSYKVGKCAIWQIVVQFAKEKNDINIKGFCLYFSSGDIFAAIYCPEDSDVFINCPSGQYCPTPVVNHTCPAGLFCSHKTKTPEIECSKCGDGATQLRRDSYGWVVFYLLIFVTLVSIIFTLLRRYKSEVFAKLLEHHHRRADDFRHLINRKKEQEQLERMKPKLDLISRRLASIEGAGSADLDKSISVTQNGVIFDARKLFDAIDSDSNGKATYSEMNAILELKCFELKEFVRRMNGLAGVSQELTEVSRETFCRYFLQVLEETSQMTMTEHEAGLMFDEIAAQGTTRNGEITFDKFYHSSLCNFLSDSQICDLIKVRNGGMIYSFGSIEPNSQTLFIIPEISKQAAE